MPPSTRTAASAFAVALDTNLLQKLEALVRERQSSLDRGPDGIRLTRVNIDEIAEPAVLALAAVRDPLLAML